MRFKKNIINTVCLLVIFAMSIGTIFDFSVQMQRTLTTQTYQTLADVSQDYNKAFLDRIASNIKTMNVLAGSLQALHDDSAKEIQDILQNAVNRGGFSAMVVCAPDGTSLSNEGVSVNLAHRNYFQKALQGKINISEPFYSTLSGEKTIVMAVPIYKGATVVGVLFGTYPLATAGTQLLDFTYYSDGYGFIVSPDGAIILSSEHADKLCNEQNLFLFFEKTNLIEFSIAELRDAVAKGERSSFTYTYNGERRFVSFVPSTVNDWYTFSVASDTLMLQQQNTTNRIVAQLALKVIVVGLLLLAWIMLGSRRHNKELRIASEKYQSLLSNINGGVLVTTHAKTAEEITVIYVSPGFTDMTGYTLEDLQTIYHGQYLNIMLEEDRQPAFEKHLQQLSEGNTYRMPYRIHKQDGSFLWVMDNGYLVEDIDGLHNHSIITDITAVKAQEEELRLSEKRFSIAVNASSGTLFEVDLKSKLYTHFENAERFFGIASEKLLADTREFSSLPFDEFVKAVTAYFFHPEDCGIALHAMTELPLNGKASYEARLRRFDNTYLWARVDLSLILDEFGAPSRLVGFMSDIDEMKKRAELLENRVQTDPMTGLYNKVAMATLTNQVLSEFPDRRHALLVLDIDNFKGINDTLGHAFGDVVLIEISAKITAAFRGVDIAGRMGGDEFAILMKDVTDTGHVLKKAAELSGALRQTYAGKKQDYQVSCSMGIIMTDGGGDSFEVLYQKADAALYQAKQRGKDQFVLYREKDAANYPIESTRINDEELDNLNMHHDVEAYIFELLYASKDFDISINRALAAIGQQYHVSRVSIFENSMDNQTTSVIYEWCNDGISSELSKIQNMSLSDGSDFVLDCFDQNGLLYCNDVRELPSYPRRLLESQGVLSTLKITIANDEVLCGFIGFDECNEYRAWTAEEIEKLTYLSKMLSVFLFKEKAKTAVLENLHTRLKILDTLPDYICVVNPALHSIEYANSKMQELLPSAQAGSFCFTTLRGSQNGPCSTCLMERIQRGDTDNLEIISEDQQVRLKIHALLINWTNNQKMVLLYGSRDTEKLF